MLDIAGQVPWGINRLKKNFSKNSEFFSRIVFLKFDFKKLYRQPRAISEVYGRRHSKLFTNCHVSRDTL